MQEIAIAAVLFVGLCFIKSISGCVINIARALLLLYIAYMAYKLYVAQ